MSVTNRLTNFNSGTGIYAYSGLNLRLTRSNAGTTTTYIYRGNNVLAEYLGNAAPQYPGREYFYAGSQLIGTVSNSVVNYYHQDHQSIRIQTNADGTLAGDRGHYPYGEAWYDNGLYTKWAFTTYKRDTESFNDYAINRFYSNRLGRFTQADKLDGPYLNPQALDRFTYVANDPVNGFDPLGLFCLVGHCEEDDGGNGGSFFSPCSLFGLFCGASGQFLFLPPGIGGPGSGKGNPMPNPKPPPPKPPAPCNQAGGAPDPSAYAAKGQTLRNTAILVAPVAPSAVPLLYAYNLFNFRGGGSLDAQPLGGSPPYANYVYGAYTSAAGLPLSVALLGANGYAAVFSKYDLNVPKDPKYTATPAANVANITAGYNAQQNGTLCHK